jgi:cell division protein FtsI/penicillin-binding protein 2
VRPPRFRRLTCAAAVLVVLVPLSGCGLFGSDDEAGGAAEAFLTAFAKGDTAGAAGRTDSAESAKAVMDRVRGALDPEHVTARVNGVEVNDGASSAKAKFSITWDLGRDRVWTYPGSFELRAVDDQWTVHWATTVLHPELAEQQSIAVLDQQPELAPVLDREGTTLLETGRVVSVLFEQDKAGDAPAVAGALASALSGFDPSITQQSILDGAAKTPKGQAYQVVGLRMSDYELVKPTIYDLPGVRFTDHPRLLTVDRAFAPALLPSVRKVIEDDLIGKAGWRVVTVDVSGAEVDELYAKTAEPAKAATLTLSSQVQNAAQAAIAGEPTPSMIVAMQPSTGELLAVAQNAKADEQGQLALTGRYPPGSTFKIVTATAALTGGTVTAETPVGCPSTVTIDGRPIPNNNNFDKGTIPLRSAFAFSCNTTFAQLASEMRPDELTKTATKLGIGVDFVLRGATTVTGSVPAAKSTVELAEDGFGQGKVVASPFGMVTAVSTVAAGTMPIPTLLMGSRTAADTRPEPVAPEVLVAVRDMMLDVTKGTAALAGFPDLRGKTGTAQFGDGTNSHAWYVGYRGDLAFAVLLAEGGASNGAVTAAARFLTALG